ncbi:MAG: tetratricopeptide repeat protein [Woeseia sp.]|nr:tetratricopeptide repeat protein [Woeseia sp.]MBT8095909.1 tetratricopeptide repeat protein [Woeseia sp.]NNE61103.1 tetratricopeptide repeat protein [Woeseia sp.]NNL54874.1 tetratricopeptide repeat protein [Woeseia sp.]
MTFPHAYLVTLFSILLFAAANAKAKDDNSATIVEDPHYGEVLFHFYKEDYFPAIVRLLAAQESQHLPHHAAEAELLLGGLYLSYGNHQRAAEIFERLLNSTSDSGLRDRTFFFLARVWQQRGYFDKARQALGSIEGDLPGSMPAEGRLLLAQMLIEQGEFDQAIELLDRFQDKTEWGSYARYNLGVALIRNGSTRDAARMLDSLGLIEPHNEELAALRDKANLALGYAYLQKGGAQEAKALLQRVRLSGPFSNKALLGVGWADAEMEQFNNALVPWMELRNRNLLDPAVQEAMLAVPYALAKVDAVSQAADQYLAAIEAFKEENERIDQTIAALRSGELLASLVADNAPAATGWHWQLEALPDADGSRYLYHLLARHEFQEGLKNYRDLDYLARNLEHWTSNLSVFRNMLDTREQAYAERLPRVQDSLGRANLEELIERKLAFDVRLDNIERDRDSLALATDDEFALWDEIAALASNPVLQANLPEAVDLQRKVRLLKGVLQWQLDKDFNERLWRNRKNVRLSGVALVETQRSRRRVDESMRNEPRSFGAFDDRIATLRPRIAGLQLRIRAVLDRQRAYLQAIAIGEMRAQQQRLQSYSVQARFALAAIYDRSASAVTAP